MKLMSYMWCGYLLTTFKMPVRMVNTVNKSDITHACTDGSLLIDFTRTWVIKPACLQQLDVFVALLSRFCSKIWLHPQMNKSIQNFNLGTRYKGNMYLVPRHCLYQGTKYGFFMHIFCIKGALDKNNIIPNFFPKKLSFLYHYKCWHGYWLYAEFYVLDWLTFEEIWTLLAFSIFQSRLK